MKIITLKTISLVALTLLLSFNKTTVAQEKKSEPQQAESKPQKVETLFGDNMTHGGYGALVIGYSQIAGRSALTSGAKGAWIINHSLGLGLAGKGFISAEKSSPIPDADWSAIAGGYGGFLVEPILFGTKPIHVSVPLIIGAGGLIYGNNKEYDYDYENQPEYPYDYSEVFDYYFVFEPGIELEFTLTQFFRLAAGISYRLTSDINITRTVDDIDYQVVKPGDLRGFSAHLAFKFGKF